MRDTTQNILLFANLNEDIYCDISKLMISSKVGSSFKNVPERSMTGMSLRVGASFSSFWGCGLLQWAISWLFVMLLLFDLVSVRGEDSLSWTCCLLACACGLRWLFDMLFLVISVSTNDEDSFSSRWGCCLLHRWLLNILLLEDVSISFFTCGK